MVLEIRMILKKSKSNVNSEKKKPKLIGKISTYMIKLLPPIDLDIVKVWSGSFSACGGQV